MYIPDFKTEQWMNDYEGKAVYNLTDTCIRSLTYSDLVRMDTEHLLDHVRLDYGEIRGDTRLRRLISGLYAEGNEKNIVLQQGCLQANETVMLTMLEAGDTVITFTPGYQQFSDIPRAIGCNVIELPLYEEENWQPRIADLEEAMDDSVKMVIINNPNNPTGTLFDDEFVERMILMCRTHRAYILSDEVYRIPGRSPSVSDLYERGISTGSLSKIYSSAGLRLGWIKAPESVIHAVCVQRDYSIISTGPLADTLGIIALQHREELEERAEKAIAAAKEVIAQTLAGTEGIRYIMPQAGTVGFLGYDAEISSEKLALHLLKESGVFFVPGSCFGCEKHLRLSLTADPEDLKKGLQILIDYLREL